MVAVSPGSLSYTPIYQLHRHGYDKGLMTLLGGSKSTIAVSSHVLYECCIICYHKRGCYDSRGAQPHAYRKDMLHE